MRINRVAFAGALAALTVTLAACGGTQQPGGGAAAPAEPMSPTTTAAAAGTGVTTDEDVFGPACSQLP
ncbi:MAG: fasciclin domain-containing protein, partial [Pseudonocardia sp.]